MRFLAVIIILALGFLAARCAPGKVKMPGFFFGASNAAFQIIVHFGYLDDCKYPPGINDASAACCALAGLAKAHIEAYRQIKALGIESVKVGLKPRFDLVGIDYQTLERKPRPSLSAYAALIKQFKRDFPNKYGTEP
ncbi:MAG: hypothetical protein ABIH24_05870 [Verrucomicrobiota bacterium]